MKHYTRMAAWETANWAMEVLSLGGGLLFYRLAQQAVAIDPVPESQLEGTKPDL